MESNKEIRVHRTGTITLGIILIVFGVLFLLHFFIPALTYMLIFRMWPLVLIMLGVEVLLANTKYSQNFTYDKGAIVILILVSMFAMFMAGMDMMFTYGATCVTIN